KKGGRAGQELHHGVDGDVDVERCALRPAGTDERPVVDQRAHRGGSVVADAVVGDAVDHAGSQVVDHRAGPEAEAVAGVDPDQDGSAVIDRSLVDGGAAAALHGQL